MLGHTHIAYGAAFAALSVHYGVAEPTVAFFLGVQIGSLAPDIDHPQAMISKGTTSLVGKSGLFSHRGFTHSIEGILTGYLLMLYVLPWVGHLIDAGLLWVLGADSKVGETYVSTLSSVQGFLGTGFAWGFLIGCISHSFIDLFNKPGILLSSLFNFRFNFIGRITRINTGTYAELAFMILGIVITFWIDLKTGLLSLLIAVIFWYLIGKPGFPKFRV
ncbi:inner membrane protein [compost metagenome]